MDRAARSRPPLSTSVPHLTGLCTRPDLGRRVASVRLRIAAQREATARAGVRCLLGSRGARATTSSSRRRTASASTSLSVVRSVPEGRCDRMRALERIPEDAPVAGRTWSLVAHLSQRVEVYSLPEPFLAEWGTSLTAAESPSAQDASGSSSTATSTSCLRAAIRRLTRSRPSSACYVDSGSSRSTASDACTFSSERLRSPTGSE